MGQASQRGSFAERQKAARDRNHLIESEINKNPELAKVRHRLGTQRLVTRMVAAQMITR